MAFTVKYVITKALVRSKAFTEEEVNAGNIFKGTYMSTEYIWQFQPFGRNAIPLGKNLKDSVEIIQQWQDYIEHVGGS